MRTAGRFLMDTPNPDGRIYVPTAAFGTINQNTNSIDGTGITIAQNINQTFYADVNQYLTARYGMSDDAEQQFGMGTPSGGFQGARGQRTTSSTPFTTPYGMTGRPPKTVAQLMAPVLNRPKGIAINAISMIYQPLGVAATTISLNLNQSIYTSGAAIVRSVLIPTTPAGSTAVSANPIIATVSNPNQNQFLINNFQKLTIGLVVNTPAGSTILVLGLFLDVAFNYN